MQTVTASDLTGVEPGRRRFGAEEKRRLVAETLRPGARVSEVARAHGVHPSKLFTWRRLAREGLLDGRAAPFVPVVLAEAGRTSERRCRGEPGAHGIEVLLRHGRVLRLDATLDPAVAARFVSALEGYGPAGEPPPGRPASERPADTFSSNSGWPVGVWPG